MKVQLIVVQGKPEGKTIPLQTPVFRIGRGETCHLRPNSEEVSREHAEFKVSADKVVVRDMGSRNGTLVNGKAITETVVLKDRDLVQIGKLTFAVSIEGAPAAVKAAPAASPPKRSTPEDVTGDDIDSWLVSDSKSPTPERPSGVYDGDTITIAAFKEAKTPVPPTTASTPVSKPKPKSKPEPKPEPEPEPEIEEADAESATNDETETETETEAPADAAPEEFIDESNPFYVKKKPSPAPAAPAKPVFQDTSAAANEILRRLREQKKHSK